MQEWKKNHIEAGKLRQKGLGFLWERMQRLVAVYQDAAFRAEHDLDDFSAGEWLDKEVSDTCATFLELMAVLEVYPERDQWIAGDLKSMVAQCLAEEAARRRAQSDRQPRKRMSAEEFRALERERDELRGQIAELIEENRSLRSELAVAQYRISELERAETGELQTA